MAAPALLPTRNQILAALTTLERLNEERGKQSFMGDEDLFLVYELQKIPISNTINRINVPLRHLPYRQSACLIVSDGDAKDRLKIPKIIEEWKDKLDSAGVTEIKKVLPLLKLKLEYSSYELRRRLSSQYDVFLAERNVMRFLPNCLGKQFFNPNTKKYPIQVGYKSYNLKQETDRALKSVVANVSLRGSSSSLVVGQFDMDKELLADNIEAAVQTLSSKVPGGQENIRSFHLKLSWSDSLPIFTSTVDRASVQVPVCSKPVSNKKRKRFVNPESDEFEEVSTIKGQVRVTRDGLIVIRKPDGQTKTIVGGSYSKAGVKRKLGGLEQKIRDGKKAKTVAEPMTSNGEPENKKAKLPASKDKTDDASKAEILNGEKTVVKSSSTSSTEESKPQTPKSRKRSRSRKRKSTSGTSEQSPGIEKTPNIKETHAATAEAPDKSLKMTPTPVKAPKIAKSPGKASKTENTRKIKVAVGKFEKTPKAEGTPGKQSKVEKTPKLLKSLENTPKLVKTPKQKNTPKLVKTPKQKNTPKLVKTPKQKGTPGKTPKRVQTPKLVVSA